MLSKKATQDFAIGLSKLPPDEVRQLAEIASAYAYANHVNKVMKMHKAAKTKSAALQKSATRKTLADHYGIPLGTPLNPRR